MRIAPVAPGLIGMLLLCLVPGPSSRAGDEAPTDAMATVVLTPLPESSPVLLRRLPAHGDAAVDPNTPFLMVRFNRPMSAAGYSWAQHEGGPFPPLDKTHKGPVWLEGGTIALLPVRLEPGRSYALRINSSTHNNFRAKENGKPLPSYSYVFQTAQQPLDDARRDAVAKAMRQTLGEASEDPAVAVIAALVGQGLTVSRVEEMTPDVLETLGARWGCGLVSLYNLHLPEGGAQVNVAVPADGLDKLRAALFLKAGQQDRNVIAFPAALVELTPRQLPEPGQETLRELINRVAEALAVDADTPEFF